MSSAEGTVDFSNILDVSEGYSLKKVKVPFKKREFNVYLENENGDWVIKSVKKSSPAFNILFEDDIIYNIGSTSIRDVEVIGEISFTIDYEIQQNDYEFVVFYVLRKEEKKDLNGFVIIEKLP